MHHDHSNCMSFDNVIIIRVVVGVVVQRMRLCMCTTIVWKLPKMNALSLGERSAIAAGSSRDPASAMMMIGL